MVRFKIEGDKNFQDIVKKLPFKLRTQIVRGIARIGGRVIVKEARKQVRIPGTLGKQFASELVVTNDRSNKSGVLVTVRKGRTMVSSRGQNYMPSVVGRHFTEGTKQKPRFTKSKLPRGKVSKQYPDPILKAGEIKQEEVFRLMAQKGDEIIRKHIEKLKR